MFKKIYNENLEDFFTRVLYFFNTLDSYFIISGLFAFLFTLWKISSPFDFFYFLFAFFAVYLIFKLSNFYPTFLGFTPIFIYFITKLSCWNLSAANILFGVNLLFFIIIQFLFMGIPDSIVSRNPKTPFRKLYLSIFTIAPTTVSLLISVYFGSLLSLILYFQPQPTELGTIFPFWLALLVAAFVSNKLKPKSFCSPKLLPSPLKKKFDRVIVLNIDGCRLDRFNKAKLPFIIKLQTKSVYYPQGLQTVYRALTNPAFASILTGTTPEVHGITSNNLGQTIKVEGLPDLVKSKLYGSMHVKHFSKKNWETKIISLPTLGIYKTDDELFRLLKKDLQIKDGTRLFVADISETDFLGHAFGSESVEYLNALKRADERIGQFFNWLKINNQLKDTAVIICSDHGICRIDHSYLLCPSEKYVPFIAYGENLLQNKKMLFEASIMDICPTISYLLGIRQTNKNQGRVLLNFDEDYFSEKINQVFYDVESQNYDIRHPEIGEGDKVWWKNFGRKNIAPQKDGLKILDLGCGTGFVGQILGSYLQKNDQFFCLDISPKMLKIAEEKINQMNFSADFKFLTGNTNSLPFKDNFFDIITINSVIHHLVNPQDTLKEVKRVLKRNGIIAAAHEPNRNFTNSNVSRLAASLYKLLGFGMKLNKEMVKRVNLQLKKEKIIENNLTAEEILQLVEFNSPIEQKKLSIDKNKGFSPEELIKTYFTGFKIINLEKYSTFFCRPSLNKNRFFSLVVERIGQIFLKQGNLFCFIIMK